jgi:hypothetical protein
MRFQRFCKAVFVQSIGLAQASFYEVAVDSMAETLF